jgi:hypothetical protein
VPSVQSFNPFAALRIIRASDPDDKNITSRPAAADPGLPASHKYATSRYGHRLDASRNLWEGSGLKVDSALTDVGWASASELSISTGFVSGLQRLTV